MTNCIERQQVTSTINPRAEFYLHDKLQSIFYEATNVLLNTIVDRPQLQKIALNELTFLQLICADLKKNDELDNN